MNLKVLQIETTNFCNAKCLFCIHHTLKHFGTMSDELFLKILRDAKKIKTLQEVIPMMLGEPFLDPRFLERLKLINKILPGKRISVYTNCSFLTKEIIEELWKIDNLRMVFSLNGTKEIRKMLMDLDDFENAIKMIKLYATKKPCVVQMVSHPLISFEDEKAFINLFPRKPPVVKILTYKNWSGDKFTAFPKTGCERAISNMTIMYDGRVNLCCMEYGKEIFGNVKDKSIKEIWESSKRQDYCIMHLLNKYDKHSPCYNCTMA